MVAELEKVLQEEITVCEVTMDGAKHVSTDFVCVLSKDNGDASLLYNTDAVTLGMAVRMISKAFVDAMGQLSEEEQDQVNAALQFGGRSDE